MNDDFLHRIRIDPPPRFVATLKARLDRLEKSPRSPERMRLRNAILLTLLGASGLAAALIVTKIYRQENTSPAPAMAQVLQSPVAAGNTPAPLAPRVANPTAASSPPLDSVSTRAAGSFRIAGPSLFQPIIKQSTQFLKRNGPFAEPDFDISDSSAAIAALCNAGTASKSVDAVIVTRRILANELRDCGLNGVVHVAEVKLGYQAVVIVRSNLYAAPQLSLQDIFLALAQQIPESRRLVKNTNVSWNQVDSALLDERIDISGPAASSNVGTAVREILLDPACATSLRMAALKVTDKSPYEDACKKLRTDGVYHEAAHDMEGYLEANPEAMAIVDYNLFAVNRQQLVGASLDGVEPAAATLSDGSYPGSRMFYLYVNGSRAGGIPRMRDFAVALLDAVGMTPGYALTMPSDSERRASHTAALLLADVKL